MLFQPRQQLDEIAGSVAVVELVLEDAVPGVLAGAVGAGQGEQIGPVGDAGGGPALYRRGSDLVIADHPEQLAEAGNLLLPDGGECLRRDVAPGHAGAAGGDHDLDRGVVDPALQMFDDRRQILAQDIPRGDRVTGLGNAVGEQVAGAVVLGAACVRKRQKRDVDRDERPALVNPRHAPPPRSGHRPARYNAATLRSQCDPGSGSAGPASAGRSTDWPAPAPDSRGSRCWARFR